MADQPAPRKLPQGAALLPAEVAEYLRRNPEFFAEHAELLAILTAPEQNRGAGIADMQRYMVQRLQTELRRRRAAEDDLVQTARANLAVQSRIHATTLALLGATTLDHLIELVTTDVALHLELDVVTLAFEALERTPPGGNRTGLRLLPTGAIETWLPRGREIVLIADQPGDPALFEGAAALVRSAAPR